jgi:hypothetical protein
MAELRTELTLEDLASITLAVRKLKPDLSDYVCVGVQVPKPGDRNVVFHMRSPKNSDGKRKEYIALISAELIYDMFAGTGNVTERDA